MTKSVTKAKLKSIHPFKQQRQQQFEEGNLFGAYSLKTLINSFGEFDRDGNSYISAGDLKILYKQLGIFVDDKSIKQIIHMLDKDGDGQIAIDEFINFIIAITGASSTHINVRSQVKHSVNLQLSEEGEDSDDITKSILAKTIARAKQYHLFESRFVFQSVVENHNITTQLVQKAYNKCLTKSKTLNEKGENELVPFEYLCNSLGTLGMKHKIHSRLLLAKMLGANKESSLVSFRGFLLGLYTWVSRSHFERIDFAFRIFDRDESEEIKFIELVEILCATNAVPTNNRNSEKILKKARFIMRQCDMNDDGVIDISEFRLVAKKFPNLILPVY